MLVFATIWVSIWLASGQAACVDRCSVLPVERKHAGGKEPALSVLYVLVHEVNLTVVGGLEFHVVREESYIEER